LESNLGINFLQSRAAHTSARFSLKKRCAVCRLAFGVFWPTLFGDKPLIFHDESSRFIVCSGHDHWRYLFNMGYGSSFKIQETASCFVFVSIKPSYLLGAMWQSQQQTPFV
jgi:hypothetical protein